MTLREQLIGAWRLVSFTAELRDGRVISPMGRAAEGLIVYSDSGVVSVNLSVGGRYESHEYAGSEFVPRLGVTRAWSKFHVKALFDQAKAALANKKGVTLKAA